jgi:hypothetical protein
MSINKINEFYFGPEDQKFAIQTAGSIYYAVDSKITYVYGLDNRPTPFDGAGGGGGGSTLADVLTAGATAGGPSSTISLATGDLDTIQFKKDDGTSVSEIAETADNIILRNNNLGQSSRMDWISGKWEMKQTDAGGANQTTVLFENPLSVQTIKIPAIIVPGDHKFGIKDKGYTVGTLPSGTIGDRAYVTDATAPTYLGTLTGGGAIKCPVWYNGTAWVSA